MQVFEHLGEALAVLGDTVVGFAEGHAFPGKVVHLLPLQVDNVFLTAGASNRSEWLPREHPIFLPVWRAILILHYQVIQVFDLFKKRE